jgi:hypothetical protein
VLRLLAERRKIGEEVVESLLAWRHSGFSVHAAVRVQDRQEAASLGRYEIRCPLVLERLARDETSVEVVYSARPSHRHGDGASGARWDVLDFLARVLDHLPEPRQQLVRYWGRYSNAARGVGSRDREHAAPALPAPGQRRDGASPGPSPRIDPRSASRRL